MSKRQAWAWIALVWVVAAVMCALPSVWPAYMHLIGTRRYEDYQLEAVGFLAGWVTKDVLSRRRAAARPAGSS